MIAMKQSEARFMAVKCALSSVEALYFTALFDPCFVQEA